MSHHKSGLGSRAFAWAIAVAFSAIVGGPTRVVAGPGEAAAPRDHQPSAAPKAPKHEADFVVLVWYRLSDPLGTFAYQEYDVRKGEHSSKVDEWAEMVRSRYPNYYVALRDVDLARERGETDKLKVGSVVYRELLAAAARAGVMVGPTGPMARPLGPGPFASASNRAPFELTRERPSRRLGPLPVQNDRSYLYRNRGYTFPIPMPYVRPHP